MRRVPRSLTSIAFALAAVAIAADRVSAAGLKTWDGKHSIDRIEVTVAYFVPSDRTALPDWRERVDYFCRRIEQFHAREYNGQSQLTTKTLKEPFTSARTTAQLRSGDADFIFFQTLREVNDELNFGEGEHKAFPILLVLSEINWRPLDDFFRLKPRANKNPAAPAWEFEGSLSNGQHFPGAASGGARATYLADRGVGWGLVSADGWRVPYRGSDCVVYHEGVGHTIGLPHPEPGNNSVMSFGQYNGWISESFVDETQKRRLGWTPPGKPADLSKDLYSVFKAIPEPMTPRPGEEVKLTLSWPASAKVASLRVRIQTDLSGPWTELSQPTFTEPPKSIFLGNFDRPTPISYRIDATLADKQTAEVWGYIQVRGQPETPPIPRVVPEDLAFLSQAIRAAAVDETPSDAAEEIDLLSLVDVKKDSVSGEWIRDENRLESPKAYGARIEIPYQPPEEYRLTIIAEPLDEPNGLILGQRSGDRRFVALVSYAVDKNFASALENIDGKNVGNLTTVQRPVLKKGRPSQIVVTVRKDRVRMSVDGRELIDWKGDRSKLGLGDYWKTPHDEALFLGAYDCRYRFSRVTLEPLSGEGKPLRTP